MKRTYSSVAALEMVMQPSSAMDSSSEADLEISLESSTVSISYPSSDIEEEDIKNPSLPASG